MEDGGPWAASATSNPKPYGGHPPGVSFHRPSQFPEAGDPGEGQGVDDGR